MCINSITFEKNATWLTKKNIKKTIHSIRWIKIAWKAICLSFDNTLTLRMRICDGYFVSIPWTMSTHGYEWKSKKKLYAMSLWNRIIIMKMRFCRQFYILTIFLVFKMWDFRWRLYDGDDWNGRFLLWCYLILWTWC